jgi:hypothetical protein
LIQKLIFFILFFVSTDCFSQESEYSLFNEMIHKMGVDFASPVDGKYQALKWVDQPFWGEHFSLVSRKENIEIKILFKPELLHHPHVNSVRWITQIASNEEETAISFVPLTTERTKELYGADWAKVFFFKPKIGSSLYSETKMIALYKEEVGMIFVFFLFNEADQALLNRDQIIRFSALE